MTSFIRSSTTIGNFNSYNSLSPIPSTPSDDSLKSSNKSSVAASREFTPLLATPPVSTPLGQSVVNAPDLHDVVDSLRMHHTSFTADAAGDIQSHTIRTIYKEIVSLSASTRSITITDLGTVSAENFW